MLANRQTSVADPGAAPPQAESSNAAAAKLARQFVGDPQLYRAFADGGAKTCPRVLDLGALRAVLGPSWPAYSQPIHLFAQRILNRHLGGAHDYTRTEDRYVVLFVELPESEAQRRIERIAASFAEFLFGTGLDDDGSILDDWIASSGSAPVRQGPLRRIAAEIRRRYERARSAWRHRRGRRRVSPADGRPRTRGPDAILASPTAADAAQLVEFPDLAPVRDGAVAADGPDDDKPGMTRTGGAKARRRAGPAATNPAGAAIAAGIAAGKIEAGKSADAPPRIAAAVISQPAEPDAAAVPAPAPMSQPSAAMPPSDAMPKRATSAKNATPPAAEPTTAASRRTLDVADLTCVYRPMWSARGNALAIAACLPAIPSSSGELLLGDAVLPPAASLDLVQQIDLMLLQHVAAIGPSFAATSKAMLIALPVHSDTLADRDRRTAYFAACRALPAALRRRLIFECLGIERGTDQGVLMTALMNLKPYAALLMGQISPQANGMAVWKRAGIGAVGIDLAAALGTRTDGSLRDDLPVGLLRNFVIQANQQGLRPYARNVGRPNLATAIAELGFDLLEGSAVETKGRPGELRAAALADIFAPAPGGITDS